MSSFAPQRRVVTNEIEGVVTIDDAIVPPIEMAGGQVFELWRADARGTAMPTGPDWSLMPADGGHVFRIAEFPPAARGDIAWMHRTATIDYGIVIDGELTLVTEHAEITIRAGDVFVQQGVDHGWINRGDRPCRMAVVLIAVGEGR